MSVVTCLSVTGCHAGLDLLERLAFRPEELATGLPRLRARAGVPQLAVLSTCQRVEVYAAAPRPGPDALLDALATERDVPVPQLERAAAVRSGPEAVHHLLRVTSGLTSFVLGEREIVGQVRAAAGASRAAGVSGPELDRLMASAVSASRRVHRATSLATAGRSVAGAAVEVLLSARGGDLAGCRLLVVGAGEVAAVAVTRAVTAGADVTVANRTLRRAERLRDAGARVVDLASLGSCLAAADAVLLATAAPHPLVDADSLREVRSPGARPLLLIDLSMPRNVDPSVRELDGVELLDLQDLSRVASSAPADLVSDVGTAERLVAEEVTRYLRWLGTRVAGAPIRRLREDADAVAREEARRVAGRLPPELRPLLEDAVLRTAHRLAHGPTTALLAAAQDGDRDLVALLSTVFRDPDAA